VFGGDALTVEETDAFPSGYQAIIMPGVAFEFEIRRSSESLAECQCIIKLDALTLAAGEMSSTRDMIAWDMILNNDVWVPRDGSRRLNSQRNYEIKDGSVVLFPRERRLQQQDVRMDFEVLAASAESMVAVQTSLEEMDLDAIEYQFKLKLSETNFTIGSVYMADNFESETVVIPGQRTSGGVRFSLSWIWMSALAIAVTFLTW